MYEQTAAFTDLIDPQRGQRDAEFARFLLREAGEAAVVLDVGAGNGAFSMALAAAGKKVYAVEPGPLHTVFLARLAQRPELLPRITLLRQKAEEIELGEPAAFAWAAALMHLVADDADRRKILLRLHRQLAPGGVLLLNFARQDAPRESPRTLLGERPIGESLVRHYSACRLLRRDLAEVTWWFETWHRGRLLESAHEIFSVRLDPVAECRELLGATGFTVSGEFEGYAGNAYRGQPEALTVFFRTVRQD